MKSWQGMKNLAAYNRRFMCDYCGRWFDHGVEVDFKHDRIIYKYCLKHWPEVEAAARKLPWYDGYSLKSI